MMLQCSAFFDTKCVFLVFCTPLHFSALPVKPSEISLASSVQKV